MTIKELFEVIIEKAKNDISAKKIQLKNAQNNIHGNQILSELYTMFYSCHYHLLNFGMTEEIRLINFQNNIITIGIPKSNYFKNYTSGESRRICDCLNQLAGKYLQSEQNRLGITDYQFCYPNIYRGIRFMTVSDHNIEFLVKIKINL